jgi:plasmid stability protein
MASITIRNLPDRTKAELRVQAAQNGLSLEAHVRRILQDAADTNNGKSGNLVELVNKYFGAKQGVDIELPSRRSQRRIVDFDE